MNPIESPEDKQKNKSGFRDTPKENSSGNKKYFQYLIGILVLAAAIHFIDFSELLSSLLKPDLLSVLIMVLIATIDRFIMAAKWLHLLILAGLRVPFILVLRAYYEAAFVARVSPIVMSSEVLRAYSVSKSVGNWSNVIGSMVIEKAIAVVSTFLLATLGSLFIYDNLAKANLQYLSLVLCLLTIGVTMFLVFSMSSRLSTILKKLTPNKLQSKISKLHNAYSLYSRNYYQLFLNWLLAVFENSLQILLLYVSARAIGIELDVVLLAGILTVSQLLRKFALVLEGWMLGEAAVVVTCAIMGIDQNQALAFSLLAGAVIIVSTSPGLILLLSPSSRQIRQEIKEQKP